MQEVDVSQGLESPQITNLYTAQRKAAIGPIAAMVIEAFASDMQTFAKGRDIAAWLGLIPRQRSSGGKTRLGQTTKMGQKDSLTEGKFDVSWPKHSQVIRRVLRGSPIGLKVHITIEHHRVALLS